MNLFRISNQQKVRLCLFAFGSLIFGGLFIIFADTFARITVAQESFSHAISECLHYIFVQPIGTALLLSPFVVTGLISAVKSKNRKIRHGLIILVCGILPIIYLYMKGYVSSQHALLDHAWTAAALSIGFMPFISVPFIIIGIFVGNYLSNYLDNKMLI